MNLIIKKATLVILCFISCAACKQHPAKRNNIIDGLVTIKHNRLVLNTVGFNFSVGAPATKFPMPALHSFVSASYNGLWLFIGGKKNGFHGTSNNPPPFRAITANDSIWVVDFAGQKSWAVPVPTAYYYALTASNSAFCQSANSLYLCGGFTRDSTSSPVFNATSNMFIEFDLAGLVQYVQSGGSAPALSQVITKAVNSPYVQVTGGELLKVNSNFYLIGGQNYNSAYSSGVTGIYTNAVRRFALQQSSGTWVIADTASVVDPVNLHRRDLNVVPYSINGHQSAILYGGVFTPQDQAYLNPVDISGLETGQVKVRVDSMQQQVNQYACAKATLSFGSKFPVITAFFGGITYQEYDPKSGKLVIGDGGVPMPFSNLISMSFQYSSFLPVEYIQLPPAAPLLPAYLGANARFIPLPQYTLNNHPNMLDGNKIVNNLSDSSSVMIGYIYGGIISLGPTSGTTAKGYVATYANPRLYQVYLNAGGSQNGKRLASAKKSR
jgi:hypothetical protein